MLQKLLEAATRLLEVLVNGTMTFDNLSQLRLKKISAIPLAAVQAGKINLFA